MHSSDVPSSFADAVIMNFPLNHLNDNDALLSVKEVNAFPFASSPENPFVPFIAVRDSMRACVTPARCGVCSRAAASRSSACKTGYQARRSHPLPPLRCMYILHAIEIPTTSHASHVSQRMAVWT